MSKQFYKEEQRNAIKLLNKFLCKTINRLNLHRDRNKERGGKVVLCLTYGLLEN